MKRGDLVTVALPGDYGKPHLALVLQSDLFADHMSVTILPLTSEIIDAPLIRFHVEPDPRNGLRTRSDIMLDKAQTISRNKVGDAFGRLTDAEMASIGRNLLVFLGLA